MYEIEDNIPIPLYFNGMLGKKHSEETKLKMSEVKKGVEISIETREKISNANKGKKLSEETKKRMSEVKMGKIISDETKKKISESHKGLKLSEETKNKISNTNKGRKHTEESKLLMSKSKLGIKRSDEVKKKISKKLIGRNVGCSSPTWKGGVSFEPYSVEFNNQLKLRIKKRDNYQCQNEDCWNTAKRIAIHHIDYDKDNCKEENLITLCTSCNTRANKNKKYWIEFYKSILKVA